MVRAVYCLGKFIVRFHTKDNFASAWSLVIILISLFMEPGPAPTRNSQDIQTTPMSFRTIDFPTYFRAAKPSRGGVSKGPRQKCLGKGPVGLWTQLAYAALRLVADFLPLRRS